jgi:hypothetical protein
VHELRTAGGCRLPEIETIFCLACGAVSLRGKRLDDNSRSPSTIPNQTALRRVKQSWKGCAEAPSEAGW